MMTLLAVKWAQTKTQDAASEHQKILFHCGGDQALAQVVQGGCGLFIPRDTQKLFEHSPGQLALGGSASTRGLVN